MACNARFKKFQWAKSGKKEQPFNRLHRQLIGGIKTQKTLNRLPQNCMGDYDKIQIDRPSGGETINVACLLSP